jgi:hypothetical protein
MLDGQADPPPDRNPSCVAAEESGRRLARAVLESMDAIKLDAVVYPSWNNPLTDRRPQFALKRSLSRAEPSSKESATNLTGKIEPALARNRRFESSSLQR